MIDMQYGGLQKSRLLLQEAMPQQGPTPARGNAAQIREGSMGYQGRREAQYISLNEWIPEVSMGYQGRRKAPTPIPGPPDPYGMVPLWA